MASPTHNSRPKRESLSKRLGRKARLIKERDNHRCVYCSRTAEESGAHLHLDHVTPKARGGLDSVDNLVVACRSCNSTRQDMHIVRWCRIVGASVESICARLQTPLAA